MDKETQSYWLAHASPESVYSWLEEHKPTTRKLSNYPHNDIENLLLTRNEPLINLGLALFSHDGATGKALFETGDDGIKKAVLSGTSIQDSFGGDKVIGSKTSIATLIENENVEFIYTLLKNEHLSDRILVSLFNQSDMFSNIDEETWINFLIAASSNPRLSKPYDEKWMDGWAEHSYNEVFAAAWRLFEKLPVNLLSAHTLISFGESLQTEAPHDMDILIAISRWSNPTTESEVEHYGYCRTFLANLIPTFKTDNFKALLNNEDIALRKSYYSRFSPRNPEELRDCFEKDSHQFLDAAISNENLYKNELIRNALSQCCWDADDPRSDMWYPNLFKSASESIEERNPAWFEDEFTGISFDSIADPTEKANAQLDHLRKKVESLTELVRGDEEQEDTSLLMEIRNDLNRLCVTMSSKKTGNGGMLYLLFGIVVGYFLSAK